MRHMAKIEENRRLEKLYNETKHRFGGGGAQIDSRTGRYFRYWDCSGSGSMKKYYRGVSNRKVRRKKDEIFSRGMHKKVFDLWWSLY